MTKRKKKSWAGSLSKRARAAYKRHYGHDYDDLLDDSGWWKWLVGYDDAFQAGIREGKRRAQGKSAEQSK